MAFSKQTIIITGGSQGLGADLAKQSLIKGYKVALIARSRENLEAVQKTLDPLQSGSITIHPVDLTDTNATKMAFQSIQKQHSSVRALVNNAGTWTGRVSAADLSTDAFQTAIGLNLYTAVNATQNTLHPDFPRATDFAIINVGATASLQGWPGIAPFCVSKGALRLYSQALARELGPNGIHVSHVIIDGLLNNARTRGLNPGTNLENFIQLESVSNLILSLIHQDRSCWTFEIDVRPFNEQW